MDYDEIAEAYLVDIITMVNDYDNAGMREESARLKAEFVKCHQLGEIRTVLEEIEMDTSRVSQ